MRFWEHIFDFQTAVNVPLRNIVVLQHLDALRRKGLGRFALTGILHDLERLFRLNALVQQIGHDAVTGSDDIGMVQVPLSMRSLALPAIHPFRGTDRKPAKSR